MPKSRFKKTILLGSTAAMLSLFVFINKNFYRVKNMGTVADSCDCYHQTPFKIKVKFWNQVPGDLKVFFNQSTADCFAWQEFIALNWPTDEAHGFGDPNDTSAVQWETYMPRDVLFRENGVAPPPWGTLVSDQYAAKFKSQKLLMDKMKTKLLTFTSKFAGSDTISNMDFGEAAPFNGPNWLGAQNSTNVWYEVLLNKDYYDYVVQKGFYNAKTQHDSLKIGHPIDFPKGVFNGKIGAIELKAAWMEVDSVKSLKWKRFKLSKATVMDPLTGKLRTTTVALVGLHILHKTQNQPTWVWATFEQIDNVPGADSSINHPYGYNFYNVTCQPQTVHCKSPQCKSDTAITVSCNVNTSPPYYLNQAGPVPIQITRVNSIDQINAAPINTKMQGYIRQFYPNSVWQYYQLVDVIWSQAPQPGLSPPKNAPFKLNASSMASGTTIVANTTMESYVQGTKTCTNCHVFSQIAHYRADTANNKKFGDFSFAIGFAK